MITIPPEIEARINETVLAQQADDKLGLSAAQTPLPGPLRDIWSPAPDITVGPFKVRRFRDGDFIQLQQLGHPLCRFTALSDGSYSYEPSGPLCWQLCWLMTRPAKEAKEAVATKGVVKVAEEAEEIFGELGLHALGALMIGITEQMTVYASAHVEYRPKQEGEKGSPPSPS